MLSLDGLDKARPAGHVKAQPVPGRRRPAFPAPGYSFQVGDSTVRHVTLHGGEPRTNLDLRWQWAVPRHGRAGHTEPYGRAHLARLRMPSRGDSSSPTTSTARRCTGGPAASTPIDARVLEEFGSSTRLPDGMVRAARAGRPRRWHVQGVVTAFGRRVSTAPPFPTPLLQPHCHLARDAGLRRRPGAARAERGSASSTRPVPAVSCTSRPASSSTSVTSPRTLSIVLVFAPAERARARS